MALAMLQMDLELASDGGGLSSRGLAADPLRLELPAFASALPSAESVRTVGALWFDVQLDAAGVIRCAEWLADRRATLSLGSEDRPALEAYSARRGSWLPAPAREQLGGRLFAVGPGSAAGGAQAARFASALSSLASALVAFGQGDAVPLILDPAVVHSALGLAGVIGALAGGSLAASATALTDQLRWSITLLERPGVSALVGARGFWDAVARMQGEHAPDLRRLLDQGRHGQTLIRWIADSLPALGQDPPFTPAVPVSVLAAGSAWIRSLGLPVREGSR